MKCYSITTLLLVTILMMACQPVTEPEPVMQAPTAAEVQAIFDAFTAAIEAGDASAIADLYTDDAIVMPPNNPAVIGKEAIIAANQIHFEQFSVAIAFTVEETVAAGDWAFTRCAFTATTKDNSTEEETQNKGKGLYITQRQPDGTLKFYRSIRNSDLPLPEPED